MSSALRADLQAGLAERIRDWQAGYGPPSGRADSFLDEAGQPRAAWARYLAELGRIDAVELGRRFASAARHIRETGISYRVYGEASDWPVSPLPLLLEEREWTALAAGIAQRATLLEAVLRDLYGRQAVLADGTLPAAALTGSVDFIPAALGIDPPGGRHLHLYAVDLARAPDGTWRVLADRTQAPSGAGYALENRLVLARAFPEMSSALQVARLAPFFNAFRAALAASATRAEPRICLLSSGPYSDTYVEQAYLARYLGFLLVEGDDLMMRDGRLHVRTVDGLKRIDVVWRRVDADYLDPLELNPQSRLGVPGLMEALRNGSLAMANMPGSGLVESGAVAAYLPALAQRLLGEDLILPGLRSWWCGDPAARAHVAAHLGDLALDFAHGPARAGQSDADRAALAAAIGTRGIDVVARERVKFGTTPVWQDGRLEPRAFVLRVFAAATPQGWQVMPGGFCRVAQPGANPLAMGPGVTSCDVWVMSETPVRSDSLLPRADEVRVRRVAGHLPSRAADNLFWFGRYLERAEAVIRLVRCWLDRIGAADPSDRDASERLRALLHRWGATGSLEGSPVALAASALRDGDRFGSALAHVAAAQRAASILRERLSTETWRALTLLRSILAPVDGDPPSAAELLECAARALSALSALSGLAQENMNRAAGWRFLDTGRRVERAINACSFALELGGADAGADALSALLELVDCQITYGARYILGVSLAPVRDMVLLDGYNPRSAAFQVGQILRNLQDVPGLRADGMPEGPARLGAKLAGTIAALDARELDAETLTGLRAELEALADEIAARYFAAGRDASRPETLAGLA